MLYDESGRKDERLLQLSHQYFMGKQRDSAFLMQYFLNNRDFLGFDTSTISSDKIYDFFVVNKKSHWTDRAQAAKNERSRLYLWIILGALLVIIAVIVLLGLQKMRAQWHLMAQKAINHQQELDKIVSQSELKVIQEAEINAREKMGQELHDDAAALLAAARWSLEALIDDLSPDNPTVPALRENLALQKNAYESLRRVIYSTEQGPVSWVDELRQFCNGLPKVYFSAFDLDGAPNGNFGLECLVIARELIVNAFKHSNATAIEVQLTRLDDVLSMIIPDNGIGFDPDKIPGNHGIGNIQKRVEKLRGNINFDTGKGVGATIFINRCFIARHQPAARIGWCSKPER